jgi:acyl-CoA hydrolase
MSGRAQGGAYTVGMSTPDTAAAGRPLRPAAPLTMHNLVFPGDLNANNTMFGGRVVAMMDVCAGLCVMQWCNRIAVTASIDAIQFSAPIRQGQMVEVVARIVFVGTTSCVVKVEVYGHDLLSSDRYYCCEGYFNMVALDSHGRPTTLPQMPVETEQQRQEWQHAREIKEAMLKRRERSGGQPAPRV